jgi:hypothetical protein
MWEVRAADGQLEELLAWVLWRVGDHAVGDEEAGDRARVYRSADSDPRIVVIDPSGEVARKLANLPEHLVARPPHSWDFELVRNR